MKSALTRVGQLSDCLSATSIRVRDAIIEKFIDKSLDS